MRIAAVDYGLNCGVAIAEVAQKPGEIKLKKLYLGTVYDNILLTKEIINQRNVTSVILEACPYRAAGHSLRIYENTYAMLLLLGYFDSKEIQTGSLLTICPGLWKPFVKKQGLDFSKWNPKSQHEEDAMSLLWYVLRTKTQIEEILYV